MPATIPQCENGKCCGRDLYDEITVKTWDALRDLYYSDQWTERRKRWVFRGQESSTWCLTTTLERTLRNRFGYPLAEGRQWENRLRRQFMRNAPRFLNQPPKHEDNMEWLALMRHYGAPTRLFDWTYSFWVALYFALESAETGGKCAVWALDIDWWKDRVKEKMCDLKDILKKASNSPEDLSSF